MRYFLYIWVLGSFLWFAAHVLISDYEYKQVPKTSGPSPAYSAAAVANNPPGGTGDHTTLVGTGAWPVLELTKPVSSIQWNTSGTSDIIISVGCQDVVIGDHWHLSPCGINSADEYVTLPGKTRCMVSYDERPAQLVPASCEEIWKAFRKRVNLDPERLNNAR